MEKNIAHSQEGKLPFIFGEGAKDFEQTFYAYLHETGHQFHAKMGSHVQPPDLLTGSGYGARNFMEWHAEHFALWTLDPKDYRKFDPLGKEFWDELVDEYLNYGASK